MKKTASRTYRFQIKAKGGGLSRTFDIPDVSEDAAIKLVEAIYACIASKPVAAKSETR